eukprot:scaffold104488_cov32-Tisochrysis_lutea.AAC.2
MLRVHNQSTHDIAQGRERAIYLDSFCAPDATSALLTLRASQIHERQLTKEATCAAQSKLENQMRAR